MTKQEVIKEAWSEFWNRLTDVQKLLALDNNGFTIIGYSEEQSKLHIDLKKSKLFDVDDNTRPKSLQGIENNNGWIKIEREEDFPKDNEDIFVLIDNEVHILSHVISLRVLTDNFMGNITHYQPIEKPKPPIY